MLPVADVTVCLCCDGEQDSDGGMGLFSGAKHVIHTLKRMANDANIPTHTEVLTADRRHAGAPALSELNLLLADPAYKMCIRDSRSLELGRTKYTANSGLKELRGEICNYLQRRFDLHYKEENILVTVGGSEAIDLTIRAVVQPGDEVIICLLYTSRCV